MSESKPNSLKVPSHWGKVSAVKIDNVDDFWCLIDELIDDQSKFWFNRDNILQAYKDCNLYGLKTEETDEMFKKCSRNESLFARQYNGNLSFYLLPALCIINKKEDDVECVILWVHSRCRRMGLGTQFVKNLKINKIFNMLKDSEKFWNSCGLVK